MKDVDNEGGYSYERAKGLREIFVPLNFFVKLNLL